MAKGVFLVHSLITMRLVKLQSRLGREGGREVGGQAGAWKNRGEGEDTLTLCCLQERRKQQRRLFDAQQIQREMSQLERQYDELEEVGRDIEQALRDAEESKCDGICSVPQRGWGGVAMCGSG